MRSETAIGPAPGPAAAVGLGERLVQVEVHDVEAHVARAADAHDRVQVGAVVVEGGARVVDDARDLLDVRVEEPERVRVGEHEAGDAVVGLAAQVLQVHPAVLGRPDLDHLVAGHGHGRRVGAVGRVRRQHQGALVAAVLVVGAASAGPRPARRASRRSAGARRAAAPRPRPARARGATSARALPGRGRATGRGAGARAPAAPPPARAAWGCASSCTSPAGRSRCRGRSCAC